MNNILEIIFFIIGAALGFGLQNIAGKVALYKGSPESLSYAFHFRYSPLLPKAGLALLNGIAWFLSSLLVENIATAILSSILFTTAILITMIDIQIRIVPNELLLVMVVAGIAFQAVTFGFKAVLISFLGMIAMIVFFTAAAGFSGFDKVGAGDIKLAGAMGLVLGYPNIMTALIIMSAAFLVYSAGGLLIKKLTLKSMLPFAPFMMSGMVFTLAFILL